MCALEHWRDVVSRPEKRCQVIVWEIKAAQLLTCRNMMSLAIESGGRDSSGTKLGSEKP